MGLDIYAGTLTRYYSHNWKTVVQQYLEWFVYRRQRGNSGWNIKLEKSECNLRGWHPYGSVGIHAVVFQLCIAGRKRWDHGS